MKAKFEKTKRENKKPQKTRCAITSRSARCILPLLFLILSHHIPHNNHQNTSFTTLSLPPFLAPPCICIFRIFVIAIYSLLSIPRTVWKILCVLEDWGFISFVFLQFNFVNIVGATWYFLGKYGFRFNCDSLQGGRRGNKKREEYKIFKVCISPRFVKYYLIWKQSISRQMQA